MGDTKVILITNVLHFIGPTAVRRLIDDGHRVVCHDMDFADGEIRDKFGADNPGALICQAVDPADVVAEVMAIHGQIDTLICNDAYPAVRAAVETAALDDLRATLEALVVWPFALISAAVPHMKAVKSGRILMVTSAAPLVGIPNYSMYATARGAANSLTLTLSTELAAYNISVNAIAPNYIENPTYFPPELTANPEAMGKILKNIPLKRLGKPEEVSELVALFASGKCDFVTGHVIPIAGGWA